MLHEVSPPPADALPHDPGDSPPDAAATDASWGLSPGPEARAALEHRVRSGELRYLTARRRFQEFDAAFQSRRSTLLPHGSERHGA